MNATFRHHHLPGQPDDPVSNSQNGFGDGGTDPDNTSPAIDTGNLPAFDAALANTGVILPSSSQAGSSSGTSAGSSSGTSAESLGSGAQSTSFVIDASYDSSITGIMNSDPTLYNEFTGAVTAAIDYYEHEITTNMTIDITFGLGNIGGAGQSGWSYGTYTYSQFYSQFQAVLDGPNATALQKAAFASLPTTDPTNGTGQFVINSTEEAMLTGDTNAGAVGNVLLSNSLDYSWTQPNTNPNGYDAVGALEHEISEVMGRADFLGSSSLYSVLDFFHYAAAGNASSAAFGSAAGSLEEPFVNTYDSSVQTYFYNPLNGKVTLPYDATGDGDVADWKYTVQSDSYGTSINGETGLVSPTDLQEMAILGYGEAPCFLPGTQIATPKGEVAVEKLTVGDIVLTLRGEGRPISWIGHGKALATRGRRSAATPVIVRKGALAENVPNHDLRVTKGHSLYIDGALIPAEYLVNHRSIVWDDRAQEVEVYHIELAEHDVLLANGTPAESYRDDGNRWMFQNANRAWDMPDKPPCAAVMTGGAVVDAVWHRLLARSGPRPGVPLTSEPDLHLMVDGNRLDGRRQLDGRLVFRVTRRPADVRIVSRAGVLDELGLARDPRPLGVALRKIVLWRGRQLRLVAADDPRLRDGFHGYEADNDFRWTDGDAALPQSILNGIDAPFDIELHVGSTTHYPLYGDHIRAAA